MTEQVSCFGNFALYFKRLLEINDALLPGVPYEAHEEFHDECNEAKVAVQGCDCAQCSRHRGWDEAKVREVNAEIKRRKAPLKEEHRYGPPMPDDPSLWEEWPPEEP